MRIFHYFLMAGVLSVFTFSSATAQSVYSTADSSVTYLFNSEVDSVREKKITHFRYDSTDRIDYSNSCVWDADSGSWNNYSKWDYKYDSNGNDIGFNWYKWEPDSADWIHRVREERKYDQNGYMIFDKEEFWNKPTSRWEGADWEEFQYDKNGNQTMILQYVYDYHNFVWKGNYKDEFEFDKNNRVTSVSKYSWNASTDSWEVGLKQKFEYEADGIKNTKTTFQWDTISEEWIMIEKIESSLDSSGFLVSRIDFNLDTQKEWVESRREEYTNDQKGNLLFKRTYVFEQDEWIEVSLLKCEYDQWENLVYSEDRYNYKGAENVELGFGNKSEYSYDQYGNQTYSARYYWRISPYWEGVNKYEYAFNDLGWMSHQLHYKWNEDLLDWEIYLSEEYLYHESGFRTTSIHWEVDRLGLDSVVISKEFFYPGDHYYTTYDSLCDGEVLLWQGQYLNSEGTYKIDYQSEMGKDSTYTLILKVNPNPESYIISGDSEVIQGENSLYVAPTTEGFSYGWFVENGTILAGVSSDSLMVMWDTPGDGLVSGYAVNIHGCQTDTVSIQVKIGPNGVQDMNSDHFTVYPVPVHDVLYISSDIEFAKVEIVDLNGRIVLVLPSSSSEINMSTLSSGTYIVLIKDRESEVIHNRKILKD